MIAQQPPSPEAPRPREPGRPSSVLSTLNADGSRRWLTPRVSPGRWLTRRRIVAYALIAVFTLIPYVKVHGKPLVLLDIPRRHFTIFGATFLPTDTLLLALLLFSIAIGVFLFTALFGRVWCGWACPQSVYMEFVYRPIERLFQGAPGRAKKGFLQTTPLGRALKHVAYFLVSCYLAHTFLAYFVGVDELRRWVTRSPFEHPIPFVVMALVTGLMLFDFGFFREQVCLVVCPYGRFQSVMLDRQSLIVTYDPVRGEPRGKAKRVSLPVVGEGRPATQGDCVDCGLCVATCPTGIDIRNGLQMECVHCTQCIDACDAVMAKLDRPPGLIRYSSQAAIAGEARRRFRPRLVVYPLLLAIFAAAFVVVLVTRGPADVALLRTRGAPFVVLPDGMVANNARLRIVNRREEPSTFRVEAVAPTGARVTGEDLAPTLAPGESRSLAIMIIAPPGAFHLGRVEATVRVDGPDEYHKQLPFRMVGPAAPGPPRT